METIARFYDGLTKYYKKNMRYRFVDEVFESLLWQYLPSQKRLNILDGGGGIGRFSIPLAQKGHFVNLVDISEKMLSEAKSLARKVGVLENIRFYQNSVTNMREQEEDYFDVVLFMNGVLDYCSNYKKAIQEAYRLLTKEGLLIGTVYNHLIYSTTKNLLRDRDVKGFKTSYESGNIIDPIPIHLFSLPKIRNVLLKKGFEIVDIFGPTNLLRKWEYEKVVTRTNREEFLELQLNFAKKKEYLNNSSDFMFICKKIIAQEGR